MGKSKNDIFIWILNSPENTFSFGLFMAFVSVGMLVSSRYLIHQKEKETYYE